MDRLKAAELHQAQRWLELEVLARQRIAAEPRTARWHGYLGGALASQGKFSGAVAAFAESVRLNPMDTVNGRNLNQAKAGELQQGCRWVELESLARQVIAAEPHAAEWHDWLGVALQHLNRPGAVEAFAEAVRLEPTGAEFRSRLSKARAMQSGSSGSSTTGSSGSLSSGSSNGPVIYAAGTERFLQDLAVALR